MTLKEAIEAINELKAMGETEDDIISIFYQMFIDDKLALEEFRDLLSVMGYELTEEFLSMSPEDQKTKGWEAEEVGNIYADAPGLDPNLEWKEECNNK